MSMTDLVAISIETPIINCEYSFKKEFTEFVSY